MKKYVAKTEQEAMEAARAELGKDAVITSIKKTQPKGLFSIFRQASVEITAIYDDKPAQPQAESMQPGINQIPMPPPKMSTEQIAASNQEEEFKANQQRITELAEEVVGARKGFKDKLIDFMKPTSEQIDETNFSNTMASINIAVGENEDNFNPTMNLETQEVKTEFQNVVETPADSGKEILSDLQEEILLEQQEKINQLQQEVETKEKILEQVLERMSGLEEISSKSDKSGRYSNSTMQLMYDVLTDQGVDDRIAQKILEDLNLIEDNDKLDINFIVKIVYNNIINILSGGKGIEINSGSNNVVCFIGPTGVGKTTTIAKLSSKLILEDKAKVGLITADTYRIAAVQQLKTYADILGIDIGVCYNNKDLLDQLESSKEKNEIILIDTAGCSVKNAEMIQDLADLVEQIPEAQKFLVLSLTTKWQDLVSIINAFGKITEFDLILTKMDETTSFGAILNLCHMTKQKIAYITNGQSVPNDIEVMSPEKIAKALLEFGGDDV